MDDYYCVEDNEVSDNEVIDSSSDDEDFKSLFTFDDSEEDFETEMEKEREMSVKRHHRTVIPPNTFNTTDDSKQKDSNEAKNDDLLYDPMADENDQKWVDKERAATNGQVESGGGGGRSDATLNCPACLTLLCRDCQRHDIYRTQYRAMFVSNCRIDFTQRLQFKDKQRVAKRKRNQSVVANATDGVATKGDTYYAVFCEVCNTRVAVYDTQEVYHFFSVLASF